jgi:hypothetical protein
VSFGEALAASFTGVEALEQCAPGEAPTVSSPPGVAGSAVPVTVTTLASYFTGAAPQPSKTRFTYGN